MRVGLDQVAPSSSVRNLGIYIDTDLSMSKHITQTVARCFGALRQLRSIRKLISAEVLQRLVVTLVITRLDYGNATLAGQPAYQLHRLQAVLNAGARLVFHGRRNEHITPLLKELHWLRAAERIAFKLAMLVFKCLHGLAPSYLSSELQRVSDTAGRRQLRSAATDALVVRRTRLATVGDRAFTVASVRVWNSLPVDVTSAATLQTFKNRLKTHLFRISFPTV